jgi:predicted nucleic-acid-binding protein
MSLRPCGKWQMIALDTNILARFYVDDPHDPKSAKQCSIAWWILADSSALFVPLTVVLEIE